MRERDGVESVANGGELRGDLEVGKGAAFEERALQGCAGKPLVGEPAGAAFQEARNGNDAAQAFRQGGLDVDDVVEAQKEGSGGGFDAEVRVDLALGDEVECDDLGSEQGPGLLPREGLARLVPVPIGSTA